MMTETDSNFGDRYQSIVAASRRSVIYGQELTGIEKIAGKPISSQTQTVQPPPTQQQLRPTPQKPPPTEQRVWYKQNCSNQELFEYNMRHGKRGKALIINNKNFMLSGCSVRQGTDMDRDSLKRTLNYMGFPDEDIIIRNDATVSEMLYFTSSVARHDYTGYDCSFVAVMSHGDTDVVNGTDGIVRIDELLEPFKTSPTLAGKPKIFLFQSCLGGNYDGGVYESDGLDEHDFPTQIRKISRESDFIIAHSTTPGYYSWRSVYTGSWFIQSFCDVMDFSGKELAFQQSLSRVCHLVSNYYESYTGNRETSGKKQSPLIRSTLTKELYFS